MFGFVAMISSLQIACYLHPRYKSAKSSTYKKDGTYIFVPRPHHIFFFYFFLKKEKNYVLWVVQKPWLNHSTLASSNCSGETCKITYGSGSIAGFFSYDDVLVGDLTVKSQVNLTLTTAPASTSVDIHAWCAGLHL
jgi:phytepsin